MRREHHGCFLVVSKPPRLHHHHLKVRLLSSHFLKVLEHRLPTGCLGRLSFRSCWHQPHCKHRSTPHPFLPKFQRSWTSFSSFFACCSGLLTCGNATFPICNGWNFMQLCVLSYWGQSSTLFSPVQPSTSLGFSSPSSCSHHKSQNLQEISVQGDSPPTSIVSLSIAIATEKGLVLIPVAGLPPAWRTVLIHVLSLSNTRFSLTYTPSSAYLRFVAAWWSLHGAGGHFKVYFKRNCKSSCETFNGFCSKSWHLCIFRRQNLLVPSVLEIIAEDKEEWMKWVLRVKRMTGCLTCPGLLYYSLTCCCQKPVTLVMVLFMVFHKVALWKRGENITRDARDCPKLRDGHRRGFKMSLSKEECMKFR